MNKKNFNQHNTPVPLVLLLSVITIGLTVTLDTTLIIPMVEVDPGLNIINTRSPQLESVRHTLPLLLPMPILLSLMAYSLVRLHAAHTRRYDRPQDKAFLLTLPQRMGLYVVSGWVSVFIITVVIDVLTLAFPVGGEELVYFLATGLAMSSTGLFGFLCTYHVLDEAIRRFVLPKVFPSGGVSRITSTKPLSIPQRHVLLWLATTLFPLLVVGLGTFTRDYVPENQLRAYIFIAIMIPLSFFLLYRTSRTIQRPLRQLVGAVEQIGQGNFEVTVVSAQNDELGYLQDRTKEMATSLGEKVRIEEQFGKAVDPRVRDYLMRGNVQLGGSRIEASVLFCDVRGFTSLSEKLPEETIVRLLNEHLAAMEAVIRSKGGMVNKFMGDGFLAVFGAPIPEPASAQAAFSAALGLVDANNRLNLQRKQRGDPEFELGIGVHSGPVIAGLIGSSFRLEYTLIGDTVNLASRIQELSKTYDATVFASKEVFLQLAPREKALLSPLGEILVRGREKPVELYCIAKVGLAH